MRLPSSQASRLFLRVSPLALVLALAACNKGGGQEGGGHGAMPPPQVTVVSMQPATVPVSFEFVGQTVGAKEVEVRGRVQGILERRAYEEGASVRAGQLLFEIDRKPYEAQVAAAEAEVATAQARQAQAQREAARLKPLVAERVASQKDYDDAASAEQISAAALKAAQARLTEAKLNLGYTTVTAPIAGVAGRGVKSEGSLVSPASGDSLLTTIVQVNPMQVNFGVAEAEQARVDREVAEGSLVVPKAGFVVQLRSNDGRVLGQGGRVLFREPRVNLQTGTVDTRAELPNADGKLRAGQFVRVVLNGASRPNAFVVPQKAVVDGPGGKAVMVVGKAQDGSPVAQPRPIEVGEWVNGEGREKSWVVRKGLNAGDQVIVDNLAKLRPGAPVSPVDAAAAAAQAQQSAPAAASAPAKQ
ncbi:MAG: efflux RND transporter periplasmic adaptor subunit [Moraxellaceae bacterium]|nr:efflux RND transporter periplasmic adaptor subunit [Moraxellaceae bacterium]